MIVYAVYDKEEDRLYQFAAKDEVLAKDAVNAFIEEQAENIATNKDIILDIQTKVSASSDVESLISTLLGYDLELSILRVE